MHARPLVLTLALLGCRHEPAAPARPPAPSTAPADALWALAPAEMSLGVVATPRALQLLERGHGAASELLARSPELARARAAVDAVLAETLGGPFATLADLGLDRERGAALFLTANGPIVVVPIGDRARLRQRLGLGADADPARLGRLTCTSIADAIACAPTAAALAPLGKAAVPAGLTALGARGDIELIAGDDDRTVAAVVQLEPGAITVRGEANLPGMAAARLGVPTRPRTEAGRTAAFGSVDLGALLGALPPRPLLPGVTMADLGRSVSGPVTVTLAPGETAVDLRVPLTDPGPATAVVERCTEVLPAALLDPQQQPGMCKLVLAELGMKLDLWVEGGQLRLGRRGAPAAGTPVAMSALGDELARGEWSFVLWGRGAIFDGMPFGTIPGVPPDQLALVVRGLSLLNELGLAVRLEGDKARFVVGLRTLWANPPEVVTRLLAIPLADLAAGKRAADDIAAAAPRSPFAADLASGHGGLVVLSFVTGTAAALAIPAFMDYTQRAKRSEAELGLEAVRRAAKVAYVTDGAFPVGEAPLTPARSCCEGGYGCAGAAADWTAPVWQALEFEQTERHHFRYSYKSDGKTLTATAEGDLDCDQIPVTFTLTGSIVDGEPVFELTRPDRID